MDEDDVDSDVENDPTFGGIISASGIIASPEEAEKLASAQRHNYYVNEIEDVGGLVTISPILRAIYDGDDHAKFLEKLKQRIDDHSGEIQKMCNHHYQGFIESINELLQVKSQAAKLKGEVTQINKGLEESTEKALVKGEALVRIRRTQCNIKAAVEALSVCLPVLEMYSKLMEQMKDRRYYPALKTIELLEHTYLPLIDKHKFAQTMALKLPKLREQIEESSMTELKDFLENIRKHSARIGEIAIRQASEQYQIEADGFDANIGQSKRSKKRQTTPSSVNSSLEEEGHSTAAQDLVDFSPVYRCYHIYSVLGVGEKFETYYRQSRDQQAKLALQPPSNMHASVEGYRQYFNEVVGFFVVEEHIAHTSDGLVDDTHLEKTWTEAVQRVLDALRTSCGYCTEAPLMLHVKTLIMLFAYTLRGYGYKVDSLLKLLLEVYEHYNEILMKTSKDSFRQLFEEDTYHPMQMHSEEEYVRILSKFPFRDEVLERAPFPRKFPFSSFVPAVFAQVKDFIGESLKFLQDLNLSQTEVEDMVRKSTNLLLTRTLSGCLTALIRKPTLGLLQLIQITINTNYLEDASGFLETHISDIFKSSHSKHHVSKLQGKSMFKDARKDAEDQIYEQIKKKIDENIELANYDWLVSEPKGQASSYMMDLIAFLNNVFQAFTNLPVRYEVAEYKDNVARAACMTACQHLSKKLMDLVRTEDVKAISAGAIEQFNLDLMQCETFARSDPVQGLTEEEDLQLFFVELRQLVDLLMDEDWTVYVQDYGKNNGKYLRVNATTALVILEKVREADKKKSVMLSFNQRQKDKRKMHESIIKQLRQMTQTNGHYSHNNNAI